MFVDTHVYKTKWDSTCTPAKHIKNQGKKDKKKKTKEKYQIQQKKGKEIEKSAFAPAALHRHPTLRIRFPTVSAYHEKQNSPKQFRHYYQYDYLQSSTSTPYVSICVYMCLCVSTHTDLFACSVCVYGCVYMCLYVSICVYGCVG